MSSPPPTGGEPGTLAFFLLLESSMRLYLSGAREFSCGPDWAWNWSLGMEKQWVFLRK